MRNHILQLSLPELTGYVELNVSGDEGRGGDLVPGSAGEHLGQVALVRPHRQDGGGLTIAVPEMLVL